jgi:3-methyladenine DNA glycosylase/8-oxoguanine DNA glycosylase
MVEVRAEIHPPWPFRLPFAGRDGVARVRAGVWARALHVDGVPVCVRAAQPRAGRVLLGARAARRDAAEEGLRRVREALGVDLDLRAFHERFRWDPLIGRSVRERPHLRLGRRPVPFEALAWAVTEQLIEVDRAHAIQRRIVRHAGRRVRCAWGGPPLRDAPTPEAVAGLPPALLCAWGLAERRAITLRRAAAVVARRGLDLRALRAIPGVGTWTLEMTAVHGLGRLDVVPAGDLGLLKLVGRLRTGDPEAVAEEAEVRELFAPYGEWRGLAAAHAMGAGPSVLAAAGARLAA